MAVLQLTLKKVNKDKMKEDNLYEQMRVLKNKTDEESTAKLAKVVEELN